MALPSEAQIRDQIGKAFWILEQLRLAAHVGADDFLENFDAFAETMFGEEGAFALGGAEGIRAAFAGVFDVAAARAMVDPLVSTYGRVLGFRQTTPVEILKELRDDFATRGTPQSVDSREFTFGAVTVDAATGDGVINRLTVDENNDEIEGCHPEIKEFQVTADEHSGTREHEEVFRFRGARAERDALLVAGSGAESFFPAISASGSLLANPSFDAYSGDAASSPPVTRWVIGTAANVQIDTINTYRDAPGVVDPGSLKFVDNTYAQQNLNQDAIQANPDVPMYLQIAWNRSIGSGTGTLTITLGSKTTNVVLSAQSGWQILRMPIGQDNWFPRWNAEDPLVKIELTGRTTGTTLVDDVILTPYVPFDGLWYAIIGGATPFLRDDRWTATDTAIEAGIIAYWFWRLYGVVDGRRAIYLPGNKAGTETWADPS